MRVLIDDNGRDLKGNIIKIFIEYPNDNDNIPDTNNPDVLALELQLQPITGVKGYRLIEEKYTDDSIEVLQEFVIAPDVAYSLYKHWEEVDRKTECQHDT